MDINHYLIYEKDCIDLAKSMIIHLREVAEDINIGLENNGYRVDHDDPTTWKYYMNLNGLYHESDPDPFLITSKDTLETIEFTKENLKEHPVTALSFRFNSDDYWTLINRNPDYEILIRGIVNPIDLDVSINSINYTILEYDERLVEEAEDSLIDELQERVTGYFINQHNLAYRVTDNLYLTANLGIFFLHLPKMIINLRLKRCLTGEAHSFHIWAHLSSYGDIDRWRDALDSYQIRYLYRNIRWINENAGETVVFNDLTKNLLSRYQIPLYGYDMRHVATDDFEQISPESIAVRYRIDQDLRVVSFDTTKSLAELTYDLNDSARDNPIFAEEAIDEVTFKMTKSYKERLVTKVLESEQIAEAENKELQAKELAITHWPYLASKDKFLAGIELKDPEAGINVSLSSMDALILYMYCGSVLLGHRLEKVPDFYCFKIKKDKFPSRVDLLRLRFNRNITDDWINELVARQVSLPIVRTVIQFNELCYQLRDNAFRDRLAYHSFDSLDEYSNAHLLTDAFWGDIVITTPYEYYSDFFSDNLIASDLITKENSYELMSTIFYNMTGFEHEEEDVDFILRSLTELMAYLSSYNVIFIYNGSYTGLRSINRSVFKINLLGIDYAILPFAIRVPLINIINKSTSAVNSELLSVIIISRVGWKHSVSNKFVIDTIINVKENKSIKHYDRIKFTPIGIIKDV